MLENFSESWLSCTTLQEQLQSNQKAKENFSVWIELPSITLSRRPQQRKENISQIFYPKLKFWLKLTPTRKSNSVTHSEKNNILQDSILLNKETKEIASTLLLKESWLLRKKKVLLHRQRKFLNTMMVTTLVKSLWLKILWDRQVLRQRLTAE